MAQVEEGVQAFTDARVEPDDKTLKLDVEGQTASEYAITEAFSGDDSSSKGQLTTQKNVIKEDENFEPPKETQSTTQNSIVNKAEIQATTSTSEEASLTHEKVEPLPKQVTPQACISKGDFVQAESLLGKGSKELSADALAQLGTIQFLRFVLSGDKKLAKEGVKRLSTAASSLSKAAALHASEYASKTQSKRSVFQVLSFQSNFSHPWSDEIPKSKFASQEDEEQAGVELAEWRRLYGLSAVMQLFEAILLFNKHAYVKGVLSLRNAWLVCKHVQEGYIDNASHHAQLVKGVFMVMLSNIPPFMQTVFKTIGFESNKEQGLEMLEHCMKSPEFEPRTLGTTVIALHHLMLSQQEYNEGIREHMNQAQSLMDTLEAKDDSIIAKFVKSHIVRRQGKIEEAVALVEHITPLVLQDIAKLEPEGMNAYRLEFDRATLHFVCLRFDEAIACLESLTDEKSTFGAKIMATCIMAACYAMKGNQAKSRELLKVSKPEGSVGKMDESMLHKCETLVKRKSQELWTYEYLYVFGHLKCYAPALTSTRANNAEWLASRKREIEAIRNKTKFKSIEDLQAFRGSSDESMLDDFEEACACVLLSSNISALVGDLETAERELEALVKICSGPVFNQVFKQRDGYVGPWSMYELAAVKLRTGKPAEATTHLNRAIKRTKSNKNPFSFSHMLAFKCAGALKESSRRTA
mmetsp:Transcript_2110/g.4024  ORF Transcript_2110/g.4024 Transcript_2110/m.4024 type:complete len:695 (-) Transcript_2110:123-2207(-)